MYVIVCNLFTDGAPRSYKNSFRYVRAFQDRIGVFGNVGGQDIVSCGTASELELSVLI